MQPEWKENMKYLLSIDGWCNIFDLLMAKICCSTVLFVNLGLKQNIVFHYFYCANCTFWYWSWIYFLLNPFHYRSFFMCFFFFLTAFLFFKICIALSLPLLCFIWTISANNPFYCPHNCQFLCFWFFFYENVKFCAIIQTGAQNPNCFRLNHDC